MPRASKEESAPAKTRSRHGCWPCKNRKIKCGEEKPSCLNCERVREKCDYRIRLNWGGRAPRKDGTSSPWSSEHISLTPPPQVTPKAASLSPGHSPAPGSLNSHHLSFSKGGETLNHRFDVTKKKGPSSLIDFSVEPDNSGFTNGVSFTSAPSLPHQLDRTKQLKEAGMQSDNARVRAASSSPFQSYASMAYPEAYGSEHHGFKSNFHPYQPSKKRRRVSATALEDSGMVDNSSSSGQSWTNFQTPSSSMSLNPAYDLALPASPTTPVAFSASDDGAAKASTTPDTIKDHRKLSVKSLLLSPPDEDASLLQPLTANSEGTVYGYDQGRPDLDIPRNDDANALTVLTPSTTFRQRAEEDFRNPQLGTPSNSEFGFGLLGQEIHFERGGYYAEPIPVRIPQSLEPLPLTLRKKPMNLLYFHHFLNHTARLLVPLECPENPFRCILPQMALLDANLLNLLLAYAASHRARLLNHLDPVIRIAHLVSDVFPNLRQALDRGKEGISNANLATAIMLASLEIISPNAFEVPVRWQDHLTIARQMIVARGGYQSLPRTDEGSYFLSRWFAYLDVLGSLSGSNYDRPLALACCFKDPEAPEQHVGDDIIDCLLGCTSSCIATLAKVADLAKQCDGQRIGLGGLIDPNWRPSEETFQAADKLKEALQNPRTEEFKGCPHRLANGDLSAIAESDDMLAINECFHWAGLIHLYRRVYGKESNDTEVQYAVAEIVAALDRTRFGGAAEASVLFPMFTAGCEAHDPAQREKILQRMMNVEGYGMTQVNRARTLMQKVWDTGRPWETLVTGEFFG